MLPQDTGAPQASAVPNLAELISSRKAERGWSYQQLADRAAGVISRQRWQQLGTGVRIKEFPEPSTIQSIADALEVDVTLVVLAVARSIGLAIRQRDSSLAAMLPPGADNLTEQQRDAVLAVVRAMAPGTGARNVEDTQPRTQEGSPKHSRTGSGSGQSGAPIAADPSSGSGEMFREAAAHLGSRARNVVRDVDEDVEPDKDDDLTDADQGSRVDYELAARKGETEDETRERLGIPYE